MTQGIVGTKPPATDLTTFKDREESRPAKPDRVASVDALRGLTILLMVFVNDLGHSAPAWLHHIQPPHADGMTLADIVFPWFLFIVGVSIPLAFERAQELGVPLWKRIGHILIRSASLCLMGVIELNSDNEVRLGGTIWSLSAFIALLLAWTTLPSGPGKKRTFFKVIKTIGFVGLIALLALFRSKPTNINSLFLGHVQGWTWLRTEWWGILGLIGWAYLTVAMLTLLLGRRREWLMGALALLMTAHLAMRHGGFFTRVGKKPWLSSANEVLSTIANGMDRLGQFVSFGDAMGSLAAISMAGCLLGSILRRDSDVQGHGARLRWGAVLCFGLFMAGLFTDTFEGINKIGATPTWCFWTAALACALWMMLYGVMDAIGFKAWSILIRPAGSNPLVAYFLHPIVIYTLIVTGLSSSVLTFHESPDPRICVGGSLGMAFFVCLLTGILGRLGLRTRL